MPPGNPKVETYFRTLTKWQKELAALRKIVLACGLDEELKWRAPCYGVEGGNVVILGALKGCCTLSFFKGALLSDPEEILEKPGENSQAGRVIRFTSVQEIAAREAVLTAYIHEAIEVQRAGLKVERKKTAEPLPDELLAKFDEHPAFQAAFEALTPGRQRGYLLHFSAPKQAATRASRIEKCVPRILDGKGMNDCVCGLSQKMPGCDGSHKTLP